MCGILTVAAVVFSFFRTLEMFGASLLACLVLLVIVSSALVWWVLRVFAAAAEVVSGFIHCTH